MITNQVKTKKQLAQELADMRQRFAALEVAETERIEAQAATSLQAKSLAAVSELAIELAAAPPSADLLELIAEKCKSISGALAVVIATYDASSSALTARYIASNSQILAQVNKLLGRNIVGLRSPVSPELYQEMVAEIVRIEKDLTAATFGAIPRPIGAAIQQVLGIDRFAGLALHYGGELMGTVVMAISRGQRTLSNDTLMIFAHLAAVSLQRRHTEEALRKSEEMYRMMEEAVRRRAYELDMLNRAGQALNASLDLDQALATTLEKTCAMLQVQECSIWLVEPGTGDLVCHSAVGAHRDIVCGWRLSPGEGLAGWIVQNGQSLITPDVQADDRYYKAVEQKTGGILRSILGVPLRAREEIIGVVEVLSADAGRFDQTDRTLLESVAVSAAIALENARLYKDLEERMAELQRTQAQLIGSAKMAAVGELAAGVAHELNNPLTAVLGFAELLLERTPPDDPSRPRLEAIARQAGRVRDIVANLLSFSRQTSFHREKADLNQVLHETLALIRLRLKAGGIVVREHYAADLPPLSLDTGRMKQVFLNLITNALQAMPHGGMLTVISEQPGDQVAVRIADTGDGIAPQHLSCIFDPFFTTKPVGCGSGLGLSVSLGIVEKHHGRIEVESRQGKGSTFTVWLPVENGNSVPDRGNEIE
jgi:signal transduction histidine kinase